MVERTCVIIVKSLFRDTHTAITKQLKCLLADFGTWINNDTFYVGFFFKEIKFMNTDIKDLGLQFSRNATVSDCKWSDICSAVREMAALREGCVPECALRVDFPTEFEMNWG